MSNKTLKIIFWGEDSFSDIVLNSLLGAGYHVCAVITPFYDNLIYKRLEKTCQNNNVTFLRCQDVNGVEIYKYIKSLAPDLCVVAHFEKLIKPELLSVPTLGFINIHPSLLPYYRGMAPQHWPIINGDEESGITVHFIDEGVDTGDIILQKHIPLHPNMYVSDLQNEWRKLYRKVVPEAIENILNGACFFRQKHLSGSYYGKLKRHFCHIDAEGSYLQAYRLIRGVSMPYCGADYNGVIIWRAHPLILESELLMRHYPDLGMYWNTNWGHLLRFHDGILCIDKFNQEV